jgi:hypothetical protein
MIRKRKITVQLGALSVVLFLAMVSLSGCTTTRTADQSTIRATNNLIGTWAGNVEVPMGASNNTPVSQLTFQDSTVKVAFLNERGTFTMNYTYSVSGETLVLQPAFPGRGGLGGSQPFNGTRPWNGTGQWNGTRPPGNETWSPNGTRPYNGSWPSNWTRPGNGTQFPGNGRSSMEISFTYYLDEQNNILFLNGSPFTKVQ